MILYSYEHRCRDCLVICGYLVVIGGKHVCGFGEYVSLRKRLDLISSAAIADLHHLTSRNIKFRIARHRNTSLECPSYGKALLEII